MTLTRPRVDPWGSPRPTVEVGQLLRFPGGRVHVVGFVNHSRARVHPLTPVTRTIIVPDRHTKKKVEKEVEETGDPIDITPSVILEEVALEDLTDAEFRRLEQYIYNGGEFPPLQE